MLGLTRAELESLALELGERAFRGRQLASWIYRRGARDVGSMTDLPAVFRDRLADGWEVGRSSLVRSQPSRDGAVKLLLGLRDGRKIETVLLPYPDRVSVCISSQVGCPVGCVFCATATMGFGRNLTTGEMVDQVLSAADLSPTGGVTHVVVMGMGEPLMNLEPLLAACRILHEEMGISYRRMTISTAGFVPGMERLADSGLPITLALSLHAPTDELRGRLIPMSSKWGVEAVMAAARSYAQKTGRRVTLEYLLLGGVNDQPEHARSLAGLTGEPATHVNLIPWNPAASLEAFRAPSREAVRSFRAELEARGVTVTQRVERGQEVAAACGQLAVLNG